MIGIDLVLDKQLRYEVSRQFYRDVVSCYEDCWNANSLLTSMVDRVLSDYDDMLQSAYKSGYVGASLSSTSALAREFWLVGQSVASMLDARKTDYDKIRTAKRSSRARA